ncbi:MAG: ferritin-like domain-containing protein [Hyphomicrobiales bacterium]
MREPLLTRHPETRAVTLRDLVGIANAIEHEAVRRYGQLADLMERRGEAETAEALRAMQKEELAHVTSVAQWAEELNEAVPPPEEFEWRLPPELAASWDEIAGTALLTPYRAFSIAVRNEERAFSLYTYLSAHAEDARVAGEADKLAGEELEHAALVRRWRRAAYHKDHGRRSASRPRIATIEDLHAHLSEREAEIAGCHRVLAARLQELGDDDSAALLDSLLEEPTRTAGPAVTCREADCQTSNPVQLLAAAQKPLEQLSEDLADVLETADAELFAAAEQALTNVVGRLARLVDQIERKLHNA